MGGIVRNMPEYAVSVIHGPSPDYMFQANISILVECPASHYAEPSSRLTRHDAKVVTSKTLHIVQRCGAASDKGAYL